MHEATNQCSQRRAAIQAPLQGKVLILYSSTAVAVPEWMLAAQQTYTERRGLNSRGTDAKSVGVCWSWVAVENGSWLCFGV